MAGAEREARIRHQAVGTPHLLMALLHDINARPAQVLSAMGYSVAQVRYEAARKIGRSKEKPSRRFRPELSERVEAAVDLALAEAAAAGRERANAEDLLLGLMTDPEGKAARLLARMRNPGAAPAVISS
jgi:ATP-dependent Clp protease ATP-binding subunit ClpC